MKIGFTLVFLSALSLCYGHLWLRAPVSRLGESNSGSKLNPCGMKTLTKGNLITTYEVGEKVTFSFRVNQHGPDPFAFRLAIGDSYKFDTVIAKDIPNNVTIAPDGFLAVYVPVTIPNVVCEWCVIQVSGMSHPSENLPPWYNCADVRIVPQGSKASPTIAKIAPNNGPTTGGTTVTITGSKFGKDTSSVSCAFESVKVSAKRVSNTTITCTSPPYNNVGAGLFSVIVDGLASTQNIKFNYTGKTIIPTITSFSPSTVVLGGTITITGTNFLSPAMSCVFGGETMTVPGQSTSTTEATCVVPLDFPVGEYPFEVSIDNSPYSQSGNKIVVVNGTDSSAPSSIQDSHTFSFFFLLVSLLAYLF